MILFRFLYLPQITTLSYHACKSGHKRNSRSTVINSSIIYRHCSINNRNGRSPTTLHSTIAILGRQPLCTVQSQYSVASHFAQYNRNTRSPATLHSTIAILLHQPLCTVLCKVADDRGLRMKAIGQKHRYVNWLVGWLVGCFGLNGPLRQYFSLYRPSPKEREKEERTYRQEKKCPNNPTRTYCKRSRSLPYYNPNK